MLQIGLDYPWKLISVPIGSANVRAENTKRPAPSRDRAYGLEWSNFVTLAHAEAMPRSQTRFLICCRV
jgi:hypothetical protein